MANPKGNPNYNLKNEPKPGPTTEAGKIRVSMNALKPRDFTMRVRQDKRNITERMIAEVAKTTEGEEKINELMASSPLNRYNAFLVYLKSMTGRQIKELVEMDNLYALMKDRITVEIIGKAERGEPLTRTDVEKLKLLKDTLETLHTLKHGTKNVNVNVGYKDVRDMMFGDQNADPGNK